MNPHYDSFWLIVWTANNIAVTLLNKAAFGNVVQFPYPYFLTAVHMIVCSVASHMWPRNGAQQKQSPNNTVAPAPTKFRHSAAAFSILFTMNICLGNVSLRYVSINLNQVVRSLVPVFTLWIGDLYCFQQHSKQQTASAQRRRAVWPVVLGVALACGTGDVNDTASTFGVTITVACALAAALKVVASAHLLVQTSPMDLLRSMAGPACIQCIVLSLVTREGIWAEGQRLLLREPMTVGVVFLSGVAAFGLNITAFEAYRATSPVTCCIAAAVKQVLLVAVATALFRTRVTVLNCIGMFLVLVASAYYSYLAVLEKESGKNLSSGRSSEPDHMETDEEKLAFLDSPSQNSAAVQRR